MAKKVLLSSMNNPPKETGLYHRLLCLSGKNKGVCYYILDKRITLGRLDSSDVQVLDSKASRDHLEITIRNDAAILTDLGSQNGTIVNDLKVTQHELVENDRIIIGQTVLKYNAIFVEAKAPVAFDDAKKPSTKKAKKSDDTDEKKAPDNKRRLFILAGIFAVIFFLLGDTESEKQTKTENKQKDMASIEIESFGADEVKIESPETRAKVKSIIHRGLREFREKNYYRAIEEFEMARTLVPNHGYASYYLNKTKQTLDEEIKSHAVKARQEVDALQYRAAIISYCSIIRLLQKYPADERYLEAIKEIGILESTMGLEEGEVKCLER